MTWPIAFALVGLGIPVALLLAVIVLAIWADPGPGVRSVVVRPRDPAPMWRVETQPLHLCRRCRRRNRRAP